MIIKRIFLIILALIVAGLLACAGAYVWFYMKYDTSVLECYKWAKETVEESTRDTFIPNKTSVVYDKNNKIIAKLQDQEKSAGYVRYDDIPQYAVNAFVAIEDADYWDNKGVSPKGLTRAALSLVKNSGEISQGGSTITQQLARNVLLTNEQSFLRKVKEIFLAYEMTKKYSKKEIMEFYINNCCFANGIYGINDAASRYLGKDLDELDLAEITYLCAIPNYPEYYNPFNNSENAYERRAHILNAMQKQGYITQEQMEQAKAEQVTIVSKSSAYVFNNYESTFAVHCATEILMERAGFIFKYDFDTNEDMQEYIAKYDQAFSEAKSNLLRGGYIIHTSFDLDLQKELQKDVDEFLANYTAKRDGVYNMQGSVTIVDNITHKVVGMIGGRTQDDSKNVYTLNRAFESYRQPGSAIKPLIVYTPGLEQGLTASSMVTNYNVSSFYKGHKSGGQTVKLKDAVRQSLNGCALDVYSQVTPEVGLSKLLDMKFTRIAPDDYTLPSGLGGFTIGTNTYEMAGAYSCLANDGSFVQPTCIMSITTHDGQELFKEDPSLQVYKRESAIEMRKILQGVVTSGTAAQMKWDSDMYGTLFGKTGTTEVNADGWFCGSTKRYSIGAWIGAEDNKNAGLWGAQTAMLAKEALITVMKKLQPGGPTSEWDDLELKDEEPKGQGESGTGMGESHSPDEESATEAPIDATTAMPDNPDVY